MPAKFTPSEVSRDSVQVVLRDSTSISPDCSAVKRSLADSGTNLTLVGSLKMAAATARQMSTSRPVQLPLSSGEEKPGRPWLTPQDSIPRSLTVLSVCAVAACVERPAAKARGRTRDTRFMAKPFKIVREYLLINRLRLWANPVIHCCDRLSDGQFDAQSSQVMDRRSRQAPQRAATEQLPRITERLASRVKGLTAVFCVLLLTRPVRAPPPGGLLGAVAAAAKRLLMAAGAWTLRQTTEHPPR